MNTRAIGMKLQRVSASLTQRDQLICVDLHEHRVLTTEQIYELTSRASSVHGPGFSISASSVSCGGFVPTCSTGRSHGTTSWMRSAPGSLPPTSTSNPARSATEPIGSARSSTAPQLRHTRAANGFFTRLVFATRNEPDSFRVAEWHGESWCARRWQLYVRPDGYAWLEGPEGTLEFVLELDRGTENRGRLEDKMERYRVLAGAETAPDVVLFCFPSSAREASARAVLGGTPMRVATATIDRHMDDPLGPNWLLLGGDRRLNLADLPRRSTA
jgi:hypothetical protein